MHKFLYFCLIFTCTLTQAQEAKDTSKPKPQDASSTTALNANASTMRIIYLKYAKSAFAQQTLEKLGFDAKIAEDSRLNALFIQASEAEHVEIAKVVQTIDTVDPREDITELYQSDLLGKKGGGAIVEQFAKNAGVETAYDEDLGLLMIKGPRQGVERFQRIVEEIQNQTRTQRKKNEQLALRVLWLSNDPTQDERNLAEPDAALKQSIAKLAELGFPNMQVKMQLLGRCDTIEGKATCKVEGTILTGNTRRTLSAEASFVSSNPKEPIQGKFSILAGSATHPNLDAEPERASVDVAINLERKKYYILSASPIDGFNNAFVVQMVDGL